MRYRPTAALTGATPSPTFTPPALNLDGPPRIGDHPLDEYAIAARRRALQVEEEGLAGLVPVDRIIAVVGGVIGGTLVAGVAIGYAVARDVAALRVRRRAGR